MSSRSSSLSDLTRKQHRNPNKERLLSDVAKEETKRLNANIPISLHTKIKIRAAEEGRDMTELVIDALGEYLST